MNKFLKILLVVVGVLVVAKMAFTAWLTRPGPKFQAPSTATSTPVSPMLDENWSDPELSNWELRQNKNGEVIVPESGNIALSNGMAKVGIQPVSDFESLVKQYNNVWLWSKQSFSIPPPGYQMVIQFPYAVQPSQEGSSGEWAEYKGDFNDQGYPIKNGFNAFGLNYLSKNSWSSGLSGLTFTYVINSVPQCTIPIKGVNPTSLNTYRMVWSQAGWSGYANGALMGTCALNTFEEIKVQLWTDNSKVPWHLFPLRFLNPSVPQWATFGQIQIWTEPIQ